MLESLTDFVSGSPWTYAFLFGVAALDAILPLVPSETSVIAAGVLAANGDLILALVVLAGALGAFLGDNASYWIGRTAGHRLLQRLFGDGRHEKLAWAERSLEERGGYLIVVARFIPGGRTAVTLAAGTLVFPWKRFLAFDAAAAAIWATYAALLGYFGGKAFETNPLRGFLLAFVVALVLTGAVEVVRWARRRRTAGAA